LPLPSLGWGTKPAAKVGIRRSGVIGRVIGGGVPASPIDDLLRLGDASMAATLEAVRAFLLIAGCVLAAWIVGYGMGYRRGVTDAKIGDLMKAEHRVNGD
jgi:hypothetical protein